MRGIGDSAGIGGSRHIPLRLPIRLGALTASALRVGSARPYVLILEALCDVDQIADNAEGEPYDDPNPSLRVNAHEAGNFKGVGLKRSWNFDI